MNARIACLVLLVAVTHSPSIALAQQVGKEPERIGQILIRGNTITQESFILNQLGFYPGMVITKADLRRAEQKLANLGIFKVDLKKGIRPTVTKDDTVEREFKDILVTVKETTTWSLKLIPGISSSSGPVISLVWEERNFDPFRWPTSRDDLFSGAAFRGAGQVFCAELLQFSLVPFGVPRVLPRPSFFLPFPCSYPMYSPKS